MGRHVWRLLRWDFLVKMIRTRAPGLYGWQILFRGTLWPGPLISKALAEPIRPAERAGHEIGLHAWDHHDWQKNAAGMDAAGITRELERGRRKIRELTGSVPDAYAAPGWLGTEPLLQVEQALGLRYGSDCRGHSIFMPVVQGRRLEVPQIPVTLPTFDESLGRGGITVDKYNDFLLSLVKKDRLNVLTIHAEVEGGKYRNLFENFLEKALGQGITFCTLGALIPQDRATIPPGTIHRGAVPGREGWVAVQA